MTTLSTPTTDTTVIPSDEEMNLILSDLATTGRSCAHGRALRLARQALDARIEAHNESQRIQNEIRKLKTAQRQQERREAEAEVRARFWAARGR